MSEIVRDGNEVELPDEDDTARVGWAMPVDEGPAVLRLHGLTRWLADLDRVESTPEEWRGWGDGDLEREYDRLCAEQEKRHEEWARLRDAADAALAEAQEFYEKRIEPVEDEIQRRSGVTPNVAAWTGEEDGDGQVMRCSIDDPLRPEDIARVADALAQAQKTCKHPPGRLYYEAAANMTRCLDCGNQIVGIAGVDEFTRSENPLMVPPGGTARFKPFPMPDTGEPVPAAKLRELVGPRFTKGEA